MNKFSNFISFFAIFPHRFHTQFFNIYHYYIIKVIRLFLIKDYWIFRNGMILSSMITIFVIII